MYTRMFYNGSLIEEDNEYLLCNCTEPVTFDKYCEYQLTHNATSFSEALYTQYAITRSRD